MSDWVLPLLVSAFPLLLVSAWTCVDESTVKSSAKAVDADNAPPPNIVAVAKISAATFLRPGFITLSFPSGECVMKTGEGLKRSPPPRFFDCSVISMESWSQVRFAGEFPRPAFRFLPAPTMLLPIVGDWLKHGFMSGRARALSVIRLYWPVSSCPGRIRFRSRHWIDRRRSLRPDLRSYACQASSQPQPTVRRLLRAR